MGVPPVLIHFERSFHEMSHPAIKGYADFWKPPYQNMLVGGIPTPLKNMKVSWDHYFQLNGKLKMFQTTNQLLYMLYSPNKP